ncbi:uncharacterized protein LOC116165778 [Photinus pyralis]|uniref:uncharacterized protein LOC116165777 n=1 Tax=Photinus pyralis TaxID=7054 RepID=UPI001267121A|nr:uncharacterized protein LOC116165777 [Photinus pyralis]XP_031336317.1 uncharacterized protein LOC116165778 [Photinus pyralis]
MAETEMRSKQIPAVVPLYVDNYEDLLDLEITATPMQGPTTSRAHMESKPCHHAIPPNPTMGQHFSVREHEKEKISSQTGPTEPSTGNAVVTAEESEPYSKEELKELMELFGLLMDDDDPSGQQSTETGPNDHGCIAEAQDLEQLLTGEDAHTASGTGESSSDEKEALTCDDPPIRES